MKRLPTLLELIVLAFMALGAPLVQLASAQTAWYVATNGTGGGTSWADATNSIQGMIDDSRVLAGHTVWVSNGVYEAGGVTNYPTGAQTNRVAIIKAITVRSFNNDPTNTIIKGAWDPATNGPAAVRCVYMTNGSWLIGFTLTNGATLTGGVGGGVYNVSIISNCILTGNSAFYGGGSYAGTLYNCTIVGNSANYYGGGVYAGTLYNCTLRGNTTTNAASTYGGGGSAFATLYNCTIVSNYSANYGGGVYINNAQFLYNSILISNVAANGGGGAYGGAPYYATMTNCTLIGNSVTGYNRSGGGTFNVNLYNCTLSGNSAGPGNGSAVGGGANGGTMYNSSFVSNSAPGGSGGAAVSTLYNSTLVGNSCTYYGGGANNSILYNCTIVGNSAGWSGGGARASTVYNCISWSNNIVDALVTHNYSCGAGYTNGGSVSGNITNDPLFITNGTGYGLSHIAGNYRLRNVSPPLNAGTNYSWMTDPTDVRSKDLDNSRRIDNFSRQVDMGCYELMPAGTMFIMK